MKYSVGFICCVVFSILISCASDMTTIKVRMLSTNNTIAVPVTYDDAYLYKTGDVIVVETSENSDEGWKISDYGMLFGKDTVMSVKGSGKRPVNMYYRRSMVQ